MALQLPALSAAATLLFAGCADPRPGYADGTPVAPNSVGLRDETGNGNDFTQYRTDSNRLFTWSAFYC